MKHFWVRVKRFVCDEGGPTMVEYALLVALIVVIAMVGAIVFSNSVGDVWSQIAGEMSDLDPPQLPIP